MKILHTEASTGMGGQERRILMESIGMRERGHEVFFAVQKGAELGLRARKEGFVVYEMSFSKAGAFKTILSLLLVFKRHNIDIINTHSSLDAWIGGIAGRLAKRFVIRTRHLSTKIRGGLNSRLLFHKLSDYVVTTCEKTKEQIQQSTALSQNRISSIPTGVNPTSLAFDPAEVEKFRMGLGLSPEDCLAGTLCVLRGWKGVYDLLHAAKLLEEIPHLKWLVVGGGVSYDYFKNVWRELKLEKKVFFTGHLDSPYTALAAMDIFLLLSWANEGVSQASLQAAWLEKPLITTNVGGLPEVCIDQLSGFHVRVSSPYDVAESTLKLLKQKDLRKKMGKEAKNIVEKRFTFEMMLDKMEGVYQKWKK